MYVGGIFSTGGGGGRLIAASQAFSGTAASPAIQRNPSIGGMERNFLAALDTLTGKALSWNPVAGGPVSTLKVSGQTVYAGGDFQSMSNKPIEGFAAFQFPANNPPSALTLVSPTDGQSVQGTSATFVWKKSTDPDNDPLTYHVFTCTDQTFNSCTSVDVASNAPMIYFAGMGGSAVLLIGMLGIGAGTRKRRAVMLLIGALLIFSGLTFVSCSGGGGGGGGGGLAADEMSTTVTGLAPGTTYYWKVVANDGQGGKTSSEVRSFSTQ